jgi:hypothetical protein
MRIPKELQPALKANRLLIISPFNEKRASKQTVDQRNIMVADLAAKLYVPYASPNGNLPKILRSPHRP